MIGQKDFDFEVKEVLESGAFVGYGSVYGTADQGNEIVEKGAFAESLLEIKAKNRIVPILWQHQRDKPIGGYQSIKEDDYGLAVEGKLLVKEVRQAAEAHALAKAGIVTGLSIGYVTVQATREKSSGLLRLKQLKLKETSLVTFPMHDDARLEAVKSEAIKQTLERGELPTLSEFEELLREVGFSRTQAKAVAGNGLSKLLNRCEAESKEGDILEALKSFKL
jgi:HK97 family phage prohead protease